MSQYNHVKNLCRHTPLTEVELTPCKPLCRHRNPKEDELTIHDDQTGERRPARRAGKTSQAAVPDGAELVAFPGINAPIPEGADPYSWVSNNLFLAHSYLHMPQSGCCTRQS